MTKRVTDNIEVERDEGTHDNHADGDVKSDDNDAEHAHAHYDDESDTYDEYATGDRDGDGGYEGKPSIDNAVPCLLTDYGGDAERGNDAHVDVDVCNDNGDDVSWAIYDGR